MTTFLMLVASIHAFAPTLMTTKGSTYRLETMTQFSTAEKVRITILPESSRYSENLSHHAVVYRRTGDFVR